MRRTVRSLALTVTIAALAAPLALSNPASADPLPGLVLDPTWGVDGVAEAGHWGIAGEDTHDKGRLAVSDGRGGAIVSSISFESSLTFELLRLDEHGDVDTTFGDAGRVEPPCEVSNVEASATSIAVAGYFGQGDGPSGTCVGRLHADGTPDVAFGEDGWLTFTDPDGDLYPDGVQLGTDGSLTVSTSTSAQEGPPRTVLHRYTAAGALDPTFGGDGLVDLTALTGATTGALAEVDVRGRALVVADLDGDHFGASVLRLTTSGALDATWGTAGISADLGAVHDIGVSARDGSVAAAKLHGEPGQVSRLTSAGGYDRRFGGGNPVDLDVDVAIRPDVFALSSGYTVVLSRDGASPEVANVAVLDDHGTQVATQSVESAQTLPYSAGWVSADGTRVFLATVDQGDGEVLAEITNIRSFVLALPALDPTVSSVTPGKGALEVAWTAAAKDTDGPVRAYEVQALQQGVLKAAQVVAGDVRQTTITGLTNGQAYDVVVRPYTAHGIATPSASSTGTPSASAAAATLATAPLTVAAAAGKQHATVSWAPPADDGGAPIIAYSVIAAKAGTTQIVGFQNRPADARSASFPGLTAGQAYDLHVVAFTSAGYGAIATATATPTSNPGQAAKAPEVSWSAAAPTPTGVLVSWGPPVERGSVTTGFTVLTARAGVPLAAVVVGPNARSATLVVTGTDPVDVYVFAQSTVGYGVVSGPTPVTR